MEGVKELERAQKEETLEGVGKKVVIEISAEFYQDPEKHPVVNNILTLLAEVADRQYLIVEAHKVPEEFKIEYPETATEIIGLAFLKIREPSRK